MAFHLSSDAVAIIGFVALFAMMLLRVPNGMAMGLVGVTGFGYIVGGVPALKMVGQTSMRTVTDYMFGVIPMFLLMGAFVSNSGMSRELFRAANGFLGHLRGGLGIATIAACGGFAAISGSSVATAATFSTVAYPEMRRYGYPQSFATGVIAAGGTLGAMLPPSTVLAVYGIITERDMDAIVAYLRTLKPIKNKVPDPVYKMQIPHHAFPGSEKPYTEAMLSDKVKKGFYLATIGHCMECHTPFGPRGGKDFVGDLGKGGMEFPGPWGKSVSRNITSSKAKGVGDWTDAQIKTAITTGVVVVVPLMVAYFAVTVTVRLAPASSAVTP